MANQRIALTAIFILVVLLSGCTGNGQTGDLQATDKLKVAATIFPLADMARVIGGSEVDVVTLLPPGSSPHTFEPTPEQMKQLAQANVFIQVGAGLDSFAEKLAHSANPDLLVVTITDGVPLANPDQDLENHHQHEPDTGHHHEHDAGDPHIWLDPVLVQEHVVPQITAALAATRPGSTDYFNGNQATYNEQLELLDRDLKHTTAAFRHRSFVTFHSVWLYFGQRYGLDDITVEAFPSKEPSAQWLTRVIEKSRANQARCVFVEPQVSAKAAEIIAAELGIPVYTVDPLGSENKPGYDSYLNMMRSNMTVFRQALG